MNFVAAYAKEHHLMEAFVLAGPENAAANSLYRRTGATQEGLSAMFLYAGDAP
jgi:hypothetical protein